MSSTQNNIILWGNRILWFIAFVTTAVILKKEVSNRKLRVTHSKIQPKYLKMWSIFTLISGPIQCLIHVFGSIPYLCYMNPFGESIRILSLITIGFFKLAKLHYCFSKAQTNTKHAYSSIVFIIMFGIGFMILIPALFIPSMQQTIHIMSDGFGCLIYWNTIKWQHILASITFFASFIWDWIIVYLYGCKIHSFRNVIVTKHNPDVYKRTLLTLQKIIFLSICYQINQVVLIIVSINQLVDVHTWLGSLLWLFIPISARITASYMQFIMIEHNTVEYETFLMFMYKLKCIYMGYCCCSTLVNNVAESQIGMELSDVVNKHNQNKSDEIETTVQSAKLPNPLQMPTCLSTVSVNMNHITYQ
eukprot:432184_1